MAEKTKISGVVLVIAIVSVVALIAAVASLAAITAPGGAFRIKQIGGNGITECRLGCGENKTEEWLCVAQFIELKTEYYGSTNGTCSANTKQLDEYETRVVPCSTVMIDRFCYTSNEGEEPTRGDIDPSTVNQIAICCR